MSRPDIDSPFWSWFSLYPDQVTIPKLYWNTKSQEQRILRLFELIGAMIEYVDELGTSVEEYQEDVGTLEGYFPVATDNIADNAITGDKIAYNTIASINLAADAVSESKIADGAVTKAKLESGIIADYVRLTGLLDTFDTYGMGSKTFTSTDLQNAGINDLSQWYVISVQLQTVNLGSPIVGAWDYGVGMHDQGGDIIPDWSIEKRDENAGSNPNTITFNGWNSGASTRRFQIMLGKIPY